MYIYIFIDNIAEVAFDIFAVTYNRVVYICLNE